MMDDRGVRDVIRDPVDNLAGRMRMSPSGRQLSVDGSHVDALLNFDPSGPTANATQIYPEGGGGLYDRAGTLERWSFTRATGWQQV